MANLSETKWFTGGKSPRFKFGKYEGEGLATVATNDRSYLKWMLANVDLSREEQDMVEETMETAERSTWP